MEKKVNNKDEEMKQILEDFLKNAKVVEFDRRIGRRVRSSLHQIIKTKEQADRFMKMMDMEARKEDVKDPHSDKETSNYCVDENLKQILEEFTKTAKIIPGKGKIRLPRGRSSLHQIIKTKEQADRFLRMLDEA